MKNKIRRYSQIIFFILFLVLLVQTEYKGADTLGQPVRIFLEIDPLLSTAAVIAAEGFLLFGVGLLIALAAVIGIGKALLPLFERLGRAKLFERIAFRYLPLAMIFGTLTWALFPFGINRGLPLPMAFGIVTVAVTLLLGRVFCGWVCPMGAVMQFTSWLKKDKLRVRIEKNQYKPHQRWKYYILIGLLAGALLGFQVTGTMDPISMVIRSFGLVINPIVNQAANGLYDLAYSTQNDAVIGVADSIYNVIAYPNILSFQEPHFMGAILLAIVFLIVLALNFRRPRYWCRVLCPLGALLGSISRNSVYRLQMIKEMCNNCGQCSRNCQGACDPEFKEGWRPAECFVCFHCVDACPSKALKFSFTEVKDRNPEKKSLGFDIKRRRALEAVAAALVAVPVIKATEQYKTITSGANVGPALHNPKLIRPPGALVENEFLQRCIRCGECMKVCPTNGLHPATLEAGVEGLWTPVLVPQIGYCEYYCTLCGQVCPTGAISKLDMDTKIKTVIGTAFFNVNRCLPYAFGTNCIVCEEHCPTSPKAIWFEEVPALIRPAEGEGYNAATDPYEEGSGGIWASPTEMNEQDSVEENETPENNDQYDPYGESAPNSNIVRQPRIDLDLCIGCGICENVCVVADEPAVYITSVGEKRSTSNRITLEGTYE